MTDYPYFKAYTTNILMDTMGMTLEQKGEYLDNLIKAWSSSNPETMPEWMFDQADKAMEISKTRSKAAKEGWAKSREKRQLNANAMQMHANAMQKPYIDRKIDREDKIEEIPCNANAMQMHSDSNNQTRRRPSFMEPNECDNDPELNRQALEALERLQNPKAVQE